MRAAGGGEDRCTFCHMRAVACVCSIIEPLTLATRVCLVIHSNEVRRTSNTGQMALRALTNSEMRIRGRTGEPLDLSDLLEESYRPFLLYPAEGAVELDHQLVAQSDRPVMLIVPDGNWRQASKVHYRHSEISHVPRVKFSGANTDLYSLRHQHRQEGMATLQAIAHAMGVLEGEAVQRQLLKLYQARLSKSLITRGIDIYA